MNGHQITVKEIVENQYICNIAGSFGGKYGNKRLNLNIEIEKSGKINPVYVVVYETTKIYEGGDLMLAVLAYNEADKPLEKIFFNCPECNNNWGCVIDECEQGVIIECTECGHPTGPIERPNHKKER